MPNILKDTYSFAQQGHVPLHGCTTPVWANLVGLPGQVGGPSSGYWRPGRVLLHDVRQAHRGRVQAAGGEELNREVGQGADLAGVRHLPPQHPGDQVRWALDAHLDALLTLHCQVSWQNPVLLYLNNHHPQVWCDCKDGDFFWGHSIHIGSSRNILIND